MDEFKFWQSWNNKYKVFLAIISFLPLAAIGLLFCAYFVKDTWFYSWNVFHIFENVFVPVGSFVIHYHEFTETAYNYIVLETFIPNIMHLNSMIAYIYLVIIIIAFSLFLALSTTFTRTYFYLGLLISTVFLGFVNVDILRIISSESITIAKPILFICILAYAGVD